MAYKRNEILKGIKAGLLASHTVGQVTVPAITAEVVIGVISPEKAELKPKVMIWWRSDRGERKDGNKSSRTLALVIGVIGKIDSGSATEQLLAIGEIYDVVHAKLEHLAETAIGTASGKSYWGMKESGSGIEPSGFDDKDSEYFVGCEWELKYERTRGATE